MAEQVKINELTTREPSLDDLIVKSDNNGLASNNKVSKLFELLLSGNLDLGGNLILLNGNKLRGYDEFNQIQDISYISESNSVVIGNQDLQLILKGFSKDPVYDYNGISRVVYHSGNFEENEDYEPPIDKKNAFNKDFGNTLGTVAQGNDSRILNGENAFNQVSDRFIKIGSVFFTWAKKPSNNTSTLAINEVISNGRVSDTIHIYSATYKGGNIDNFGTLGNGFEDGSYKNVNYEKF